MPVQTNSDVAIEAYVWIIGGESDSHSSCDGYSHGFPDEGAYSVKLKVVDSAGAEDAITQIVLVQDWLIVAIGDSYGSGEGVPDEGIPPAEILNFENLKEIFEETQLELELAIADQVNAGNALSDTLAETATVRRRQNELEAAQGRVDDACPLGRDCVAARQNEVTARGNLTTALVALGIEAVRDVEQALRDIEAAAREAVAAADAVVNTALDSVNVARRDADTARNNLKPTWQNDSCHRSGNSGQARAARALELSDPQTSVTFIHLSCSGATIPEGLLGPFRGVDEKEGKPFAQLELAKLLVGDRDADSVLISIGGNDVGFADIVSVCALQDNCHEPEATLDLAPVVGICLEVRAFEDDCLDEFAIAYRRPKSAHDIFHEGIDQLEARYEQVACHLVGGNCGDESEYPFRLPGLSDDRVLITQYPNATQDAKEAYCDPDNHKNALPGVSATENEWAKTVVTTGLNAKIANTPWTYVEGIFDDSLQHGYCSDSPSFVRIGESYQTQGNYFGSVHPNSLGHDSYRDHIYDTLNGVLNDFNQDGEIDDADVIDRLCAAIRRGDESFDLNGDRTTDHADLTFILQNVHGTTAGDANLDGIFNSSDLLQVFRKNEYEDGIAGNSGWKNGDWNWDAEFDSADLIAAFQAGSYTAASQGIDNPAGVRETFLAAARPDVDRIISPTKEVSTQSDRTTSTTERQSHDSVFRDRPPELFMERAAVFGRDRVFTWRPSSSDDHRALHIDESLQLLKHELEGSWS